MFRAKLKEDLHGPWVYGSLIEETMGIVNINKIISGGYSYLYHKISKSTLGESIGLKDEDGVEIFEGDILVNTSPNRLSNKPFVVERTFISGGYGYWFPSTDVRLVKIIGNIVDNPNLAGKRGRKNGA